MVREWLRIICPTNPDLGPPTSIAIVKGRSLGVGYRGENLHAVNGGVTLVQPLRRGADFEARFEWQGGSHELVATYAAATNVPSVDFDNPKPEAASGDVSGSPPAERSLPPVEPPLADVSGIEPPPTDADWDGVHEVVFGASGDLGCETKIVGSWFRAKCADPKFKVIAIEYQKGHHEKQSIASVDGGVGVIVTPYVEGTETWARFHFEDGVRMLVLRWSHGPRPTTAGAFETLK
jgi:hypothetical protein